MQKIEQVPGLYFIDNITDKIDTTNTLTELDKLKWVPLNPSFRNSRIVQHYGYLYDYKTYKIDKKTDDLPKCLEPYQKYLTEICLNNKLTDKKYNFNQCIVNNYAGAQGISKHIDVRSYGSVIGCFTLNGGGMMRFTKGDETFDIYTKPNSLYIMTGEARSKWCHEMLTGSSDTVNGKQIERSRRVSITFRQVSMDK
jgi:alkylated DNA repair dioxygenase AlkB